MKCPKCKRDTYSKKWDQCSNRECPTNKRDTVTEQDGERDSVTPPPDTKGAVTVQQNRDSVTHCPTCTCEAKKVYATNADRQRAYRQRSDETDG